MHDARACGRRVAIVRLFDTAADEMVAFEPGPVVRIYTCGITPYDATHMGHAATYITYDVLHRRLLDRGHEVRLVRNITDVDDDLLSRARRDGVNYLDLAFGQKRRFDEVTGRAKGENPDDPAKRHPLDTVLWKPSLDDEPAWESPWGRGRPGWHIECAALSLRELGPTVDIHGGGCDLVYPHHEFFAAQTDAVSAGGVSLWMHQSCVELNDEHMSKSTGNLIFVSDLFATHPAPVVRLAVLSTHYRTKPWNWRDELLDEATERLARWTGAGLGQGPIDEVRAALDDDLDVPAAVAAIDAAATRGEGVAECAALLGVRLEAL